MGAERNADRRATTNAQSEQLVVPGRLGDGEANDAACFGRGQHLRRASVAIDVDVGVDEQRLEP